MHWQWVLKDDWDSSENSIKLIGRRWKFPTCMWVGFPNQKTKKLYDWWHSMEIPEILIVFSRNFHHISEISCTIKILGFSTEKKKNFQINPKKTRTNKKTWKIHKKWNKIKLLINYVGKFSEAISSEFFCLFFFREFSFP